MRILEMPLHFTVTATTRSVRANERDGVDYHFISEETFRRMLDEGNFLEHAQVYGNWYGVPKPQVRNAMASGNDVVVKIDVQGAATIKRLAPQAVMIFVVPPSIHELERRLKWRMTESDESLRRRVEESRSEMEHIGAFDYVVTNDALDEAVHQDELHHHRRALPDAAPRGAARLDRPPGLPTRRAGGSPPPARC